MSDMVWMQKALSLACQAEALGEVPVGAVVVREGALISEAYNQPIQSADPAAHAEIMALRLAGQALQNYRLPGCTLYVTLEPCMMCMGAIIHARIDRLVFGAFDPKSGCVASQMRIQDQRFLNHQPEIVGGVCERECALILRNFFKERR